MLRQQEQRLRIEADAAERSRERAKRRALRRQRRLRRLPFVSQPLQLPARRLQRRLARRERFGAPRLRLSLVVPQDTLVLAARRAHLLRHGRRLRRLHLPAESLQGPGELPPEVLPRGRDGGAHRLPLRLLRRLACGCQRSFNRLCNRCLRVRRRLRLRGLPRLRECCSQLLRVLRGQERLAPLQRRLDVP
jgi:hypothetical protein